MRNYKELKFYEDDYYGIHRIWTVKTEKSAKGFGYRYRVELVKPNGQSSMDFGETYEFYYYNNLEKIALVEKALKKLGIRNFNIKIGE